MLDAIQYDYTAEKLTLLSNTTTVDACNKNHKQFPEKAHLCCITKST